jgi:hypothetical protein
VSAARAMPPPAHSVLAGAGRTAGATPLQHTGEGGGAGGGAGAGAAAFAARPPSPPSPGESCVQSNQVKLT